MVRVLFLSKLPEVEDRLDAGAVTSLCVLQRT